VPVRAAREQCPIHDDFTSLGEMSALYLKGRYLDESSSYHD
jgi:hypothetical protein